MSGPLIPTMSLPRMLQIGRCQAAPSRAQNPAGLAVGLGVTEQRALPLYQPWLAPYGRSVPTISERS